jgi:hypothetical protein
MIIYIKETNWLPRFSWRQKRDIYSYVLNRFVGYLYDLYWYISFYEKVFPKLANALICKNKIFEYLSMNGPIVYINYVLNFAVFSVFV